MREQTVLVAVLTELRKLMPFELLGFDTDNDSVFINETVRDYCAASGIAFTRCRPYRKNDQAWIEQKNGSVVRRLVGYRRFEGMAATTVLADWYAAARLFVNPRSSLPRSIGTEHESISAIIRRRRRISVSGGWRSRFSFWADCDTSFA